MVRHDGEDADEIRSTSTRGPVSKSVQEGSVSEAEDMEPCLKKGRDHELGEQSDGRDERSLCVAAEAASALTTPRILLMEFWLRSSIRLVMRSDHDRRILKRVCDMKNVESSTRAVLRGYPLITRYAQPSSAEPYKRSVGSNLSIDHSRATASSSTSFAFPLFTVH